MVWEVESESDSIVTRELQYWGIPTFLGTPTKGSPASAECEVDDHELLPD
jgi:hypothetical protein